MHIRVLFSYFSNLKKNTDLDAINTTVMAQLGSSSVARPQLPSGTTCSQRARGGCPYQGLRHRWSAARRDGRAHLRTIGSPFVVAGDGRFLENPRFWSEVPRSGIGRLVVTGRSG